MTLTAAVVYTAVAIGVIAVIAMAITLASAALACLGLAAITGICVAGLAWAFRGQARHDAQALAMICDPCNGKPGRCLCAEKCGHPLCGADDTGVRELRAELDAMLGEEGKQ